jgi:FtsP/CotA-like multicopper oxidase with cupredoxin domain
LLAMGLSRLPIYAPSPSAARLRTRHALSRSLILILLLSFLAAGAAFGAYLASSGAPKLSGSCASAPRSAYFTVYESDFGPEKGMNGSAYHKLTEPWPVMKVCLGQTVTIHVMNVNSSEVHGFAIDHYFDSGVALSPGDSYTLTFVARASGYFRVYCNVLCLIHPEMINGELLVSN